MVYFAQLIGADKSQLMSEVEMNAFDLDAIVETANFRIAEAIGVETDYVDADDAYLIMYEMGYYDAKAIEDRLVELTLEVLPIKVVS